MVDETEKSQYLLIKEAQDLYNRSRIWFFKQIQKGILTKYEFPGDIRTYVSRRELDDLFHFRPAPRK